MLSVSITIDNCSCSDKFSFDMRKGNICKMSECIVSEQTGLCSVNMYTVYPPSVVGSRLSVLDADLLVLPRWYYVKNRLHMNRVRFVIIIFDQEIITQIRPMIHCSCKPIKLDSSLIIN